MFPSAVVLVLGFDSSVDTGTDLYHSHLSPALLLSLKDWEDQEIVPVL